MNVFDEEMGPLATGEELQTLLVLAEADLTLDELRAYWRHRPVEVN